MLILIDCDTSQRMIHPPEFIERVTPKGTRTHKALWKCECGSKFVASENNVRRGHTKSCGCRLLVSRIGSPPKHGHFVGRKPSPTYISWQSMIQRCCDRNAAGYKYYGGKGVKIDRRWREDFSVFLAEMGERPDGMTLDRYPNPFGHYEPNNCRWATPSQQMKNRRDNYAKHEPDRENDAKRLRW